VAVTTRSEDLLRRALQHDDPDDSLRAVAALRARLNAVEEDHVRDALRAGSSWADIARSLGISRQAAHRRFAERCRPDADPAAAAVIGATPQARQVVRVAAEEAAAMGHVSAGPEHLLLALLRDDVGPAVQALEELDVYYSVVRREVRALYGDGETSPEPKGGRAPISTRARRILERAVREAVESEATEVGVEHILLAVVRDTEGGAARALAALGVTPRRVEMRLRRAVVGPRPPAVALR
jgi:transposase-like protein